MAFAAARMIKDKKDQEQKLKRPVEASSQSKVCTFGVFNNMKSTFGAGPLHCPQFWTFEETVPI